MHYTVLRAKGWKAMLQKACLQTLLAWRMQHCLQNWVLGCTSTPCLFEYSRTVWDGEGGGGGSFAK